MIPSQCKLSWFRGTIEKYRTYYSSSTYLSFQRASLGFARTILGRFGDAVYDE